MLILACIGAAAQDSTYYFQGWGKPGSIPFVPRETLKKTDYTQVRMVADRPVMIKHFTAANALQDHRENEYDQFGNHSATRSYYPSGQLREEIIFRNDPKEMTLFKQVFGPTFSPENSNFMIRREYNEYGRETGYFIEGVRGQMICSRVTTYREDRRKERELVKDDLKGTILADRRYKYFDNEGRTVLEEFNGQGKLVQRVVLFDQNEILQE